jgi:hypothetical protein
MAKVEQDGFLKKEKGFGIQRPKAFQYGVVG